MTEVMDSDIDKNLLKRVLTNSMDHVGMESGRQELFEAMLTSLDAKPKSNRLSQW